MSVTNRVDRHAPEFDGSLSTTLEDACEASVRRVIKADVEPLFSELRRFVDRRLAEISTEVHGAVTLVDMSEANLTEKLSQAFHQIGQLVAVPAAATRNSGLELEAVVRATETAAMRIMEAAEAISDVLGRGPIDANDLPGLQQKLESIFEACTFQDVTGQRIRRAIDHLQKVESLLAEMSGRPLESEADPVEETPPGGADLMQDDIDNMLFG